jgi:hypothetical protein
MISPLDTSALWDAQERVFRNEDGPGSLRKFAPLVAALRLFPGPSNLTIRHDVATGNLGRAVRDFNALCPGGYYKEGLSYLLNVETAFAWAGRSDIILPARSAFTNLAAPDGTVPTNDTRETDRLTPPSLPGGFQDARYTVLRPRPGAYVLIHHDTDVADGGPHVDPGIFGHIAAMIDGKWVAGHPWYTGWANKGRQAKYNTIYGYSRWPLKTRLVAARNPFGITLRMGAAKRDISWTARRIAWTDYGGKSYLNGSPCSREQEIRFDG